MILYRQLRDCNRGFESHPALRCGGRELTFGEFFALIAWAEAGFRRRGVRAGDIVAMFALNTPEALCAFYALDRIGAVSSWVDVKLNPSEVERTLNEIGAHLAVVLELSFAKVHRNLGNAQIQNLVVLPIGPYLTPEAAEKLAPGRWRSEAAGDARCLAWEAFLGEPAPEPDAGEDRADETAVIEYTGGTTGIPKGVLLSGEAFRTLTRQYEQAGAVGRRGETALALLPVFAVYGLGICMHVPLCAGMTLAMDPLFRPRDLGRLLVRYRPQQVTGTTSFWQALLQSKEAAGADLSFLKNPRNGGDGMPPELERRVNAFLAERGCKVRLIKEYGMTEVSGICCMDTAAENKPGSVGRPLAGNAVRIADPDTGRELPPGEQGEVLISSAALMRGYFRNEEATRAILERRSDGRLWVHTKDWGYVDEDGDLFLVGRIKRMFSRNGFKIFPAIIEECLLEHPMVEVCAVVGAAGPTGETVPRAWVVLKEGFRGREEEAEAQLDALCRGRLNDFLIPWEYRFRTELPLTGRGKLDFLALEQED